MRQLRLLAVLGWGGPAPAPGAAHEPAGQSLADAASRLCAAPMRAEADPEWSRGGSPENANVVAKHYPDGVTNRRVLALIEGWKAGKPTDQRLAELDSLTHDALLSSKCRLRELWQRSSLRSCEYVSDQCRKAPVAPSARRRRRDSS